MLHASKRKTGVQEPREPKLASDGSNKQWVPRLRSGPLMRTADLYISKRKVSRQDSTDSSSRRSETPTLASSRSRRAPRPTSVPNDDDAEPNSEQRTEHQPKTRSDQPTSLNAEDPKVSHTPSPRPSDSEGDNNRSAWASLSTLDGLSHPSSTLVGWNALISARP